MEHTTFSKKYVIVNEVFNAITHGIGTGLSIAGLILLIIKGAHSGSALQVVSFTIFGSSMVLLFLSSTLFHSLYFTKARKIFQVFDHTSIYIFIAGSYMPFCLITIKGWFGWTLWGVVLGVAVLGIIFKSIWLDKKMKGDVVLYVIMGWLCIFAAKPLYDGLGIKGFILLVLGGLSYTIGAYFYSKTQYKFMHVVWHLFVLLGAVFIFFAAYLYI